MHLIFKKNKLFFLFFSNFLIIYGFNNLEVVENYKLTFISLLPIFLFIILIKNYKFDYELKLTILIITFFLLSTINTLLYYDDAINTVLFANIKIFIIIILFILFNHFYDKREYSFDKYIIYITMVFMVSNLIYYFYFYDFMGRFEGTFGGSNEFAYLLVFYIYLIYYYFFKYKNNNILIKTILIFSLLGLHLLIIITLSRGAIIGLIIFYLFSIFYFNKRIQLWKKIVGIVIIIFIFIQFFSLFEKSITLLEQRFINKEGESSLNSRIHEINAGWELINQNYKIILLGAGTSITSNENFYKRFYLNSSKNITVKRIHNTYIALFIENGVISLFLFVYLLAITTKNILTSSSTFKYVMLGYIFFTIFFLNFIYLIYFLPFWFSILLINIHAKNINTNTKD
jgi:O-antigen ligase